MKTGVTGTRTGQKIWNTHFSHVWTLRLLRMAAAAPPIGTLSLDVHVGFILS